MWGALALYVFSQEIIDRNRVAAIGWKIIGSPQSHFEKTEAPPNEYIVSSFEVNGQLGRIYWNAFDYVSIMLTYDPADHQASLYWLKPLHAHRPIQIHPPKSD